MKRFRYLLRRTRSNAKGQHVIGFGARVGYWPCQEAYYLQFSFWKWNLDIWHGLASYLKPDKLSIY